MHAFADVGMRDLGLPVGTVGITEVDDLEPVEDLQTEVHVVGARFIGCGTDRARAEARPGPVGGGDVERRPHDGHVGPPGVQLVGLGEERAVPE